MIGRASSATLEKAMRAITLFLAKSDAKAMSALTATRVTALVPRMWMPCARVGKFCHATCSFFSFPTFSFGAFDVSITREIPSRSDLRSACAAKK